MPEKPSFEDFRKKGRDQVGMKPKKENDVDERAQKHAMAEEMKRLITEKIQTSSQDEKERSTIMNAINRMMHGDDE